MARRFITRIELTPSTRGRLTEISQRNGMTQVAVLSRLVQWFGQQNDGIQGMILGLYPPSLEQDIAKLILEQMLERKPERG